MFSAVLVAVLSVVLIAWFLGGKSIVEKSIHKRTQPWVVFQVPETPVPLTGLEATQTGNLVTVCNRSNDDWSKVLVQIDEGYLAGLDQSRNRQLQAIEGIRRLHNRILEAHAPAARPPRNQSRSFSHRE